MNKWDGTGLVSTEWLAENLEDPALRIYDATVHLRPSKAGPYTIESGLSDYEAGHVPGAAFIDLINDLSDTTSKLAFTMPSADHLAKGLGAAGISGGQSRRRLCHHDSHVGDAGLVDASFDGI